LTAAAQDGRDGSTLELYRTALRLRRELEALGDGELRWLPDPVRLARYLRPDELHTAFNFPFLACPWDAAALHASISAALASHAPVDAPATWVLSNHDVTRPVTRYGRADTSFAFEAKRVGTPNDLVLGTRRARAAGLLTMALPGSRYVYQGEELGLPEVEDIPDDRRQDPMWHRSGGRDPGRDGCRIPIPWSGDEPPYGFSGPGPNGSAAGRPWLDPPAGWAHLTVAAQSGDPDSMLALYREGLRLRRSTPWGRAEAELRWAPATAASRADSTLSFARGERFSCLVNFGPEPVALPADARVLIASGELEGGAVPQDTTVWLSHEGDTSTRKEVR
jgi:alpha-glucosidase